MRRDDPFSFQSRSHDGGPAAPRAQRTVSRRRLLGMTGGALASLPFLTHAQSTPPRRLVLFFTPHGTSRAEWLPKGGERGFTFGRVLEPLTPWRDKLVVLDGVNLTATGATLGGHNEGMEALWTGTRRHGSVTSIDQMVADAIGKQTPFASLEFGVKPLAPDAYTRMIFRGGQYVHPMGSPYDAFDRVFANVTGRATGSAELDRLRADQRSVLDFVKGDLERIRQQIGRADQARLDAHLESVRSIETRLSAPATGKTCAAPTLGNRLDVDANDNFPTVGQLQMDLLAASLGCGLTRVASLQWSAGLNDAKGIVHRWVGATDNHHSISHQGACNVNNVSGRCNEVARGEEAIIRIGQWYAKQFAYLLSKLASMPEGAGTVLDNTLVVWGSEVAAGNHSSRNAPFVLAGGLIPSGRFLQLGGIAHNDLLVTIGKIFGLPLTTVGQANLNKGPIGALLG